jgi:hypothetical protein
MNPLTTQKEATPMSRIILPCALLTTTLALMLPAESLWWSPFLPNSDENSSPERTMRHRG